MTPEQNALIDRAIVLAIEAHANAEDRLYLGNPWQVFRAHLAAALSQAEAYRVDAERYRWLRDSANNCKKRAPMVFNAPYGAGGIYWNDSLLGEKLDAAIDEVRKVKP